MVILTKEQQRWCAERGLGMGFDDDDEDKVQYRHVCETIRGGTKPAALRVGKRTRRKQIRLRRVRNLYARVLSVSISRQPRTFQVTDGATGELRDFTIARGPSEKAHLWRERYDDDSDDDPSFPRRHTRCDGCLCWIGDRPWTTWGAGPYFRDLGYCRACAQSGVPDRDRARRVAAMRSRVTDARRSRVEALCRSPRLWCGEGEGYSWPGLDASATSEERSAHWAKITCEACVKLLAERGCPMEGNER